MRCEDVQKLVSIKSRNIALTSPTISITLIFSQPKTILFQGGGLNEENKLREQGWELGENKENLYNYF